MAKPLTIFIPLMLFIPPMLFTGMGDPIIPVIPIGVVLPDPIKFILLFALSGEEVGITGVVLGPEKTLKRSLAAEDVDEGATAGDTVVGAEDDGDETGAE